MVYVQGHAMIYRESKTGRFDKREMEGGERERERERKGKNILRLIPNLFEICRHVLLPQRTLRKKIVNFNKYLV